MLGIWIGLCWAEPVAVKPTYNGDFEVWFADRQRDARWLALRSGDEDLLHEIDRDLRKVERRTKDPGRIIAITGAGLVGASIAVGGMLQLIATPEGQQDPEFAKAGRRVWTFGVPGGGLVAGVGLHKVFWEWKRQRKDALRPSNYYATAEAEEIQILPR